jgi:hypothetical protein
MPMRRVQRNQRIPRSARCNARAHAAIVAVEDATIANGVEALCGCRPMVAVAVPPSTEPVSADPPTSGKGAKLSPRRETSAIPCVTLTCRPQSNWYAGSSAGSGSTTYEQCLTITTTPWASLRAQAICC